MIKLYDNKTNRFLGEISEQQLQFLIDQLEEESTEDRDYAITKITIAFFESRGADLDLIGLLRQAMGENDEVVIRWSR